MFCFPKLYPRRGLFKTTQILDNTLILPEPKGLSTVSVPIIPNSDLEKKPSSYPVIASTQRVRANLTQKNEIASFRSQRRSPLTPSLSRRGEGRVRGPPCQSIKCVCIKKGQTSSGIISLSHNPRNLLQ